MRRRRARLLAIVTGVVVIAFAAMIAARRPPVTRPSTVAGSAPDGAAVYARLGCPACHSLGGAGNPSHPLDGVGRRLSRDALRTWIVAPQQMKPGVQKPAYDRVPSADVETVVDLLAHS